MSSYDLFEDSENAVDATASCSRSHSQTDSFPDKNAEAVEEDVELTPKEVIDELLTAWRNECFAPELLPHRFEVVDCVVDQIKAMESNLSRVTGNQKTSLRSRIHSLELDRIRYILASYLRTRVKKIEKHVHHYVRMDATASTPSMSNEETVFANEYKQVLEEHLDSTTLQHLSSKTSAVDFDEIVVTTKNAQAKSLMPRNIRRLMCRVSASQPNLESFVFVRAMRECSDVQIQSTNPSRDPPDAVDLAIDTHHVLPYSAVAHMLRLNDTPVLLQ